MRRLFACLLVCSAVVCESHFVQGHDETAEKIEQFKQDGTYDERAARIESLQQYKLSEGLRRRTIYKVRRAALEAEGLTPTQIAQTLSSGPQPAFPFVAQPELRSHGTVKTLTVLIDFKDHRAVADLPGMTLDTFQKNIYGSGTSAAAAFVPHESLHNYYARASQGAVDVQGNVLGWHSFPNNRDDYAPLRAPITLPPTQRRQVQQTLDNKANFRLLSEALDALDASHDFSQYDNDNDGDLDLVTILYAGPSGDWGSFWWAYRWEFFIPEATTKTFDGKRTKQFVFQFVSRRGASNSDFDPTTLMHEMGHAFGLADYYDYEPGVGPDGGVGGLDMMHANQGNQCAFSRWLLDWIKPKVVGSGAPISRRLTASSSTTTTDKAIAIFPGLAATSAPSEEMFIIENRHRMGNDAKLPGDGLLIWHVDASVNNTQSDFLQDNSYTDIKLIRLIRADNKDDFGSNDNATAQTYFVPGKQFSPTSSPSSERNDSTPSGVSVDQIGALGEHITAVIGFVASPAGPGPSGPTPAPPTAPSIAEDATPQQIVAALVAADGQTINLDALELLDRKLAPLTSGQVQELWQTASAKKDGEQITSANLTKQLLLTRLASKDGQKAVDAVLSTTDDAEFARQAYSKVLESWANQAPAAAGKWYLSDDKAAQRASLNLKATGDFTHEVFETLYQHDADAAVEALEKLKSPDEVIGALKGMRHVGRQTEEGARRLMSD
ncbi:MAG: M6 family metalloprotease domain-containing protein [Pirellulales bacterium]